MKTFEIAWLSFILTLACLGAVLSLAMGLAIILPDSAAARAIARVLPLSEVHWRTAEAALIASPSDGSTAKALTEADAEVAAAPNRLRPYMQRAFIRARVAHGVLTPGALADFAYTYELSPADHGVAPWREWFAYNHWQELTTPLRIMVMREHVLAWNLRRAEFAVLDNQISNRAGHLAYRLTQRDAEAAFRAKYSAAKVR